MSRSNPFACPPLAALGRIAPLVAAAFLVAAVAGSAPAQDSAPVDDEGRIVQFERDIAPILRQRCLECHGPEDAKNDFRVDDPDSLLGYVEAGDWEFSSLFVDYLATEDEDMLMPPPAHGGPLKPAELSLLRVWIDEGAEWPEGVELVATQEVTTESGAAFDASTDATSEGESGQAPMSLLARVWAFQGYFHPATVHFPIALLCLGAMFVVIGVFKPSLSTQVPMACLLIGAVSSIAATLMGWSFATQQGYAGWTRVDFNSEIFWHRWSGVVVTVLATILAAIAIVAARRNRPGLHRVWKVGLLVLAGMVGLVGHQGGELTYGSTFYPRAFAILYGETDQPEEAASEGESTVEEDAVEEETQEE